VVVAEDNQPDHRLVFLVVVGVVVGNRVCRECLKEQCQYPLQWGHLPDRAQVVPLPLRLRSGCPHLLPVSKAHLRLHNVNLKGHSNPEDHPVAIYRP
jgi:hypothetical protein